MCYDNSEVKTMDERNLQEKSYVPRPRWQVWTARAALVLVIIGVICYYWTVANPV